MNQSVRALVAVDDGVDHALVQSALPAHQPEIQIVGIVDGLEEGWSTLQETPTDLLIIPGPTINVSRTKRVWMAETDD